MSLADAERLRKIHTFPSLVKYLRDDLGWPIESDDFDELTFEYEPAELGLDPKTAVKVEKILQLRPLTANQPFGVFFLHFQPKHLPVVALRRILQALTLKKRASANKSDIAAWHKNDLLFISAHGEEGQRTITFAHFREDEYQPGDLPTLRVLGWDDRDTVLHLGDAHDTLTRSLSWPRDEEDVDTWREQWSSAFSLRHREVITTSKRLASRLAELARIIRTRASAVLAVENKRPGHEGPLTKLHTVFKTALIHDLSEDDFADMYAQTIAYGLLSARVSRPAGLVADNITDMVPVTNPFLKEMLEEFLHVGGRKKNGKTGLDFDELGVTEVVETLRAANMEAVLRDFGDRNPQEDPVIHFYELFLKEYDAKKRMQRGVFYTPRPVVSYIVRSVHELLQTEFGLEDGLADTTTWGEMVQRFPAKPAEKGQDAEEGLKIPEGTPPGQAFVQILDPATGTGTFLVEVIDVIHKTMVSKWEAQGHGARKISELWNDYVPKHLLPRLHGYELMMAPYAIAHMKIGLKLYETGYRFESDERARVYLTNSLEPPQDFSGHFDFDIPALAHEADAVNEVKRKQRFTVVIGNPPYAGISANRNEWIEGLLRGETSLSQANYYEIDGVSLAEKKLWLQDDYVKFMRLSHFLLEQTSVGIHGMITNHSFADSPTCRGMRFQMHRFYSNLHIIDLHGSTKRAECAPDGLNDENVFDILPGVAICIAARTRGTGVGEVKSYDLWGTRHSKSNWLLHHSLMDCDWTPLAPKQPYCFFVSRNLDFDKEYLSFYSLKEIFPFYGTGIQTSRDDFAVDFERSGLEERMRFFFDQRHSDGEIADTFRLRDTRGWKMKGVRRSSSLETVLQELTTYLFRVFDVRWIALTKDIVDWPRLEVTSCVDPAHLGLICSRQQSVPGFRHVIVVNAPADMFCISNKSREGQTLFPLFVKDSKGLFRSSSDDVWEPNLGAHFSRGLAGLLRSTDSRSRPPLCTADDSKQALHYIYACLHSPAYRARYVDLLKVDYPRLPLTGDIMLFRALTRLGGELVSLHLMESPTLDAFITTYTGPKNPEVGRVGWSKGTVWLDAGKTSAREGHRAERPGTIGFKGVPEQVWDFHIGGYQVCHKWLKDRQGRTLSDDDIAHYQKIIVALSETIRIMAEIDDVIDQHGGWPAAFQTGADRDDA